MHPQFIEASITFCAATGMAIYAATRSERSLVRVLVFGLMVSMMTWTGGVMLSRVLDTDAAIMGTRLAFAGVFFLPPVWFALAAHLTGLRWFSENRVLWWALAAPSAAGLLALLTNPLHLLLIADPAAAPTEPPAVWAGPVFWVWAAWAYVLIIAGAALYVRSSLRVVSRDERGRGWLLAGAACAPLVASLIHNSGMASTSHDRTPLFLGVAIVLLFFVDWRYRLLDTVPLARRDVIDHLADGVIVADARGSILDMNAAAEAMVGASLSEMIGRNIVTATAQQAEDRMDFDEEAFFEAIKSMCESPSDFRVKVENYQGRVFEIRGSTVQDSFGGSSGLYLILRDCTEAEHYEAVLQQNRRYEAVAGLAAGIAHEVNNPLAYIRANLSHAMRSVSAVLDGELKNDAEQLQETLAVLEESLEGVDRIGTIIDRVQRFSREDGYEVRILGVNAVVEDAIRLCRLDALEGIDLELDLAASLPDVDGSMEGLLQAVLSLLSNAVQSVESRSGRIRVRTREVDGMVEIRVDDNGPGVPQDIRDKIFDPFFTTRREGHSTGLGLALTFKLISEQNGSVSLEESEWSGAAFVIRLPISSAKPSDQAESN